MKINLDEAVKEIDALSEKLYLLKQKPGEQIEFRLHEAVNDAKAVVAYLEAIEARFKYGVRP